MKQTAHSSSSGLSGCAMGCSELEEAQPARRASPEKSPAALESGTAGAWRGGCANCNTPVQAPGSNPTVPGTNTEPHRSYSSLVAAQTSACLSRMPEFPGGQQTLTGAALIAGELLPVPAQPSPAPCSHLILFPACVIYSAGDSHPEGGWHWAAPGPAVPGTQLPLPWPGATVLVSHPELFPDSGATTASERVQAPFWAI